MFATIRSVDAQARRCTVEIDSGSGRRLVSNVLLGEAMPGSNCTPENGQQVEIQASGRSWYVANYYSPETERANQEREHLDLNPGDNVFGGVGEGTVGVLKGGIVVAQADETTGLLASKNGVANFMGKTMAFLNSLYQKTIVDTDIKLRIEEVISGPLLLSAKIKRIIDTLEAEHKIEYNGFKKIDIKVDGDPLSPVPRVGTEVEASLTAMSGVTVSFKINGTTGDIEIQSGLAKVVMKAVTGEILIGSDGNPLHGLVTGETICAATGVGHCGVSSKVKAGR